MGRGGMGRTEHPECDRCSLDCCRARDAVWLILGSITTVAAGTSAATCTVGQGFGSRQRARQSPSGMMNLSIRRSTLDLLKRQTLCQALDACGAGRVVPDQGRRWRHPRLRETRAGDVFPIKIFARAAVRESNLVASALRNDLVPDDPAYSSGK